MSAYYILDSKAESDQCRAEAFAAYIAQQNDPAYVATTTEWSAEQMGSDGKFIVPFCQQLGVAGYKIEDSAEEWFTALPPAS
jgi:hypothetical protein